MLVAVWLLAGAVVAAAPAVAAFPGQNGKIAFTGYGDLGDVYSDPFRHTSAEIYAVNADGSGEARLTDNASLDFQPAFSPDGTKIVFVSDRDGPFVSGYGTNEEIYTMNADGTDVRRLTYTPYQEEDPTFSPDGAKIAFTSARDTDYEIYVMNADGSDQVNISNHRSVSSHDLAADIHPAFSPDGTKIAFASSPRERGGSGYEIYMMNSDGSAQTRLTDNLDIDYEPAFSPDGTKIAFTSYRDTDSSRVRVNIYAMTVDGTGVIRLTDDSDGFAGGLSPAFSPDGTKIAFSRAPRGGSLSDFDVYTMNADGTGSAQLTNRAGGNDDPDWQPIPAAPAPPAPGPGPAGPGPGLTPPAPAAPVLSGASVSPGVFRASGARTPRGRSRPRPVGTRVRFSLSKVASVRMTVDLRARGRRVGRSCLVATRARRFRPRCTRFVSRGFISFSGRAGANSVAFNGRVRGRALPAGAYRATLVATDSGGRRSKPRVVYFRVVRR